MKWIWITVGVGACLVLGSRVGGEQFERVTRWSKGASKELGVSMTAHQIAESARAAGGTLNDAVAGRSQSLLSDMADTASSQLDSAAAVIDSGV